MHNQHAGLSQLLADQRTTERRDEAAHARLARGGRRPHRRRRAWVARRWWQLARWPAVATVQPVSRPPTGSARREGPGSTMRQAVHPVPMRVLYLALAIALSVAAATATPAPSTTIEDLADQRKALYQSELEQNLLLRTQLGYGFITALGPLPAPPT